MSFNFLLMLTVRWWVRVAPKAVGILNLAVASVDNKFGPLPFCLTPCDFIGFGFGRSHFAGPLGTPRFDGPTIGMRYYVNGFSFAHVGTIA